ncbi:serine/threonine protein kinase [Candidatus Woesearchaeota archaeon]|nr:MAG: serine/threonine protein kinase [Candidatus Woesearchaeota archaeon]
MTLDDTLNQPGSFGRPHHKEQEYFEMPDRKFLLAQHRDGSPWAFYSHEGKIFDFFGTPELNFTFLKIYGKRYGLNRSAVLSEDGEPKHFIKLERPVGSVYKVGDRYFIQQTNDLLKYPMLSSLTDAEVLHLSDFDDEDMDLKDVVSVGGELYALVVDRSEEANFNELGIHDKTGELPDIPSIRFSGLVSVDGVPYVLGATSYAMGMWDVRTLVKNKLSGIKFPDHVNRVSKVSLHHQNLVLLYSGRNAVQVFDPETFSLLDGVYTSNDVIHDLHGKSYLTVQNELGWNIFDASQCLMVERPLKEKPVQIIQFDGKNHILAEDLVAYTLEGKETKLFQNIKNAVSSKQLVFKQFFASANSFYVVMGQVPGVEPDDVQPTIVSSEGRADCFQGPHNVLDHVFYHQGKPIVLAKKTWHGPWNFYDEQGVSSAFPKAYTRDPVFSFIDGVEILHPGQTKTAFIAEDRLRFKSKDHFRKSKYGMHKHVDSIYDAVQKWLAAQPNATIVGENFTLDASIAEALSENEMLHTVATYFDYPVSEALRLLTPVLKNEQSYAVWDSLFKSTSLFQRKLSLAQQVKVSADLSSPTSLEAYKKTMNAIGYLRTKHKNTSGTLADLVDCSRFSGPELFLEKLGSGKAGITYLVYSPTLDKEMAMKIVKDEFFNPEEAKVLSQLSHPNIVRVWYASDTTVKKDEKPVHAILMDYVDGKTLEELVKENPQGLSVDQVIPIALQLFNAVYYLQKNNIFHRDLNLRNVKMDSLGRLKVMDFGIASSLGASPKDNRKFGGGSDLFSYGLILYHLLTGIHFIDDECAVGVSSAHAEKLAEAILRLRTPNGDFKPEYEAKLEKEGLGRLADVIDMSLKYPDNVDGMRYRLENLTGYKDLDMTQQLKQELEELLGHPLNYMTFFTLVQKINKDTLK